MHIVRNQIPAGPSVTMGPRLLETAYGLTGLQAHGRKDNRLWLRYSIDKGITWQQVDQALSEDIKIHGEPSGFDVAGQFDHSGTGLE